MMTLTRCIKKHWHWVERDLISLGYRADDIGTNLTLWELVSIVVAAPIGTAVREKLDGGWTQSDRLLANLGEQQAGVLQLTGRYPRPGISADQTQMRSPAAGSGWTSINGVTFQPMDKDEFVARRRKYMVGNQRAAQENPEEAAKRKSHNVIPGSRGR